MMLYFIIRTQKGGNCKVNMKLPLPGHYGIKQVCAMKI